jgi:hypothetical protein
MKDTKKKLPEFKDEDRETKFWATADSTQYLNWQSGKRRKLVHLARARRTEAEQVTLGS